MTLVAPSRVSTIKMTAEQFLQLGEDPPGVRLELVNGEIAVSPSPVPSHAYVVSALAVLVGSHVKQYKLGRLYLDVGTIFGEFDVRRLDMLFFSKDRLHLIGEKAMEGPPDLAVEVISPSSIRADRTDKFNQYQKARVPHYWIVDPRQRSVEAYKLTRTKYRLTITRNKNDVVRLPPFDDLDIPLAELWQPAK